VVVSIGVSQAPPCQLALKKKKIEKIQKHKSDEK